MSHQTGIEANDELRVFFGSCRDGSIRLVKISIENEELVLSGKLETKADKWEDDYETHIGSVLEESQPCFILFRLDSKTNSGYEWLLFTWSPDSSPVRQKMLYASTKATLRKEFGAGQIKEEVFATTKDETSWTGYLKHKRNRDAPAPLTMSEEERAEIKRNEVNSDIGVDTRHKTLQGLGFPLTAKALDALTKFQTKQINYVQLKIEIEKELIELVCTTDTDAESLRKRIPETSARYHLFNFQHTHEGKSIESFVFIYSMPGYNCSIKERMLYSSCKGPLIYAMEHEIGLTMDKKLEIDNGNDLCEDFLREELHPPKAETKVQFAKPKGPANRGAKRLTKATNGNGVDE